jgi:hypothetical protein
LNVTVCGQKGQPCPTQVQAWAFKMKISPSAAALGFKGQDDKGYGDIFCCSPVITNILFIIAF